jgi:TetR/AcrR family transcriptional regulator, transcriptional repressor for nem operon
MIPIMSVAADRRDLSHERIIDAAARALRRSGCNGVGVADVMREAGLTHGGFYAHFESREDLLVAALERAGLASNATLSAAVERGQRAGESPFSALVHAYLGSKHCRDVERGCPVAALASELPRQSAAVRRAAEERVRGLVSAVRAVLPATALPADAPLIAATLVGTLQLARSMRGPERDALLASARQSLIERYEPAR